MPALAVGMAVVSWGLILQGYCLIKGYNVTVADLWSPNWPKQTAEQKAQSPSTVTEKTSGG